MVGFAFAASGLKTFVERTGTDTATSNCQFIVFVFVLFCFAFFHGALLIHSGTPI